MFGLFGKKKKTARRDDDSVWGSDTARRAGLLREAERAVAAKAGVVIVASTPSELDSLVAALMAHEPLAARDALDLKAVRLRLAQAGSVSLVLGSAFPPPTAPSIGAATWPSPVEILVSGRHEHPAGDDAVLAFADTFGPAARVAFHLCFDDPLFRHIAAGPLKEVMQRLGMTEAEPVKSALVTRSIEQLRRQVGDRL